jgi:hypothetical protein
VKGDGLLLAVLGPDDDDDDDDDAAEGCCVVLMGASTVPARLPHRRTCDGATRAAHCWQERQYID